MHAAFSDQGDAQAGTAEAGDELRSRARARAARGGGEHGRDQVRRRDQVGDAGAARVHRIQPWAQFVGSFQAGEQDALESLAAVRRGTERGCARERRMRKPRCRAAGDQRLAVGAAHVRQVFDFIGLVGQVDHDPARRALRASGQPGLQRARLTGGEAGDPDERAVMHLPCFEAERVERQQERFAQHGPIPAGG